MWVKASITPQHQPELCAGVSMRIMRGITSAGGSSSWTPLASDPFTAASAVVDKNCATWTAHHVNGATWTAHHDKSAAWRAHHNNSAAWTAHHNNSAPARVRPPRGRHRPRLD